MTVDGIRSTQDVQSCWYTPPFFELYDDDGFGSGWTYHADREIDEWHWIHCETEVFVGEQCECCERAPG